MRNISRWRNQSDWAKKTPVPYEVYAKMKYLLARILKFLNSLLNFFGNFEHDLLNSFRSQSDFLILLWLTLDDFTRQWETSQTGNVKLMFTEIKSLSNKLEKSVIYDMHGRKQFIFSTPIGHVDRQYK